MIVLDIAMPELDGWPTLERIHDITEVPVLMLTAREGERRRSAASRRAPTTTSGSLRPSRAVARVAALLRRASSRSGGPSARPTTTARGRRRGERGRTRRQRRGWARAAGVPDPGGPSCATPASAPPRPAPRARVGATTPAWPPSRSSSTSAICGASSATPVRRRSRRFAGSGIGGSPWRSRRAETAASRATGGARFGPALDFHVDMRRRISIQVLAARQHGVGARGEQLLEAGLAPGADRPRRSRAGRLQLLHRRHVYAVGIAPRTDLARWMAATLACDGVAQLPQRRCPARCCRSAIAASTHVTARSVPAPPADPRPPRPPAPDDHMKIHGIPVTGIARTLIDLDSCPR